MTTVVLDHVEVNLSIEQIIKAFHQLSEAERTQVWHEFEPPRASAEARWRERLEQWEQQHRAGYERYPVTAEEFEVWLPEQAWGDE